MAVTLVAAAAAQNAGVTTPAATAAITPTVTTTTLALNPVQRCFVFQSHSCETGSAATPTNWTAVYKDVVVGTGTASAAAGRRFISCYYRNYDGSWSMPSFDLASATQNSHAIATLTVACDPTETFDTPTFSGDGEYFGTAGTAFSAATPAAFNAVSKAFLMAHSVTNDNVTATAGAITGSGFTAGTVTERADGGTATGNDVTIKLHTCSPTTGANVALTHTMTLSAASQGGWAAVQQTATYGGSTPSGAFVYDTFRDADGVAITAHTGEVGATWTIQGGGWTAPLQFKNNRLYATGATEFYASGTPPSADYSVTLTFRVITQDGVRVWVTGRTAAASDNFYGLWMEGDAPNGYLFLYKETTGFVVTDLGAGFPQLPAGTLTVGSTHTLKLTMVGNQISGSFDNGLVTLGPFTDNTHTAAGFAGCGGDTQTATTSAHFESIVATSSTITENAAAAFTGTGALTATATPEYDRTAAFTGSGVLSTVISPIQTSTPALSGSGTLSATATRLHPMSAALSGSGALTATFVPTLTTALSGSGVLSATANPAVSVNAVLLGSGVLSATIVPQLAATLTGSGALSATVSQIYPITAALASSGVLTATATAVSAGEATPALTGGGALTATTVSRIMLAQWGFLDNLEDTSGNSRHGTFTAGSGGSLTYVNGPTANTRGIQFSHADDFVDFGRTGLEPSAEGVTTMGWVYLPATGTALILGVLSKARVSTSSRHRLAIQRGTGLANYLARWKDDLQNNNVTGNLAGAWHHLALVDGNTRWQFYVDGVSKATGSRAFDTTPFTWEAHNWRVGRNSTITDVYADPTLSVSGIRIFQGELTTAEVTAWMNTPIEGGTQAPAAFTGGGALSATVSQIYPIAAALTGTGILSATATASYASAAVLSGSGVLSATFVPKLTAALVGDGVLTATMATAGAATGAFTGSGVLSATVSQIYPITVSSTGTGSLTATATRLHPMSAALSGSGVLSATFVPTLPAALSGSGTLSAAINQIHPRAAALTGTGALSATAIAVYARTATLTGIGVTTAVVSQIYPIAATLTGTGVTTAVVSQVYPIAAALTGTGTLTAVTAVPGITSGAFTGTGALSATISQIQTVTAPLTGTGALTAAFTPLLPATLSGSGTLSATVVPQLVATLTSTGTLTATINQIHPRAAVLTGAGTLTAATATAGTTAGVFTGSGALSATFSQKYTLTTTLTGSGALVGGIAGTGTVTATLTGSGTLSATVAPLFTPALSGSGSLTATAIATGGISATLSGSGTLSASVVPIYRITATHTGAGTLSATTSIVVEAFHPYPDAVFTVRAENTTITIKAENAAVTVKPENDTATIKPENIGFTVKPANTALVVKPDNNLLTV